jgi:hypothetical protein
MVAVAAVSALTEATVPQAGLMVAVAAVSALTEATVPCPAHKCAQVHQCSAGLMRVPRCICISWDQLDRSLEAHALSL